MRLACCSIRCFVLLGPLSLLATPAAPADVIWPLDDQNATHALWHTYGQYVGQSTPHFHEGLDIPVEEASTPDVMAAEDGTVEEVLDLGRQADYMTVSRTGAADKGWRYVHITVGMHPTLARKWQAGDPVAQSDVLGAVHNHTVFMDHLHFSAVNDSNGGWSPAGARAADLEGDPLDLGLTPNTDGVKPTLPQDNDGHFFYREAAGEGANGAVYFDEMLGGRIVISDNTDIVARAYDTFGNHVDYDVGVKKIQFSVAGLATIATQTLEDFSGLFLIAEDPANRNALSKFRSEERTHTIYENDATATSRGHTAGAGGVSANDGKYFYILTNKDDDDDNEFDDADRYWDTDGKKGQPWNDDQEGNANEARNNADAEFPDGFYTVTITAFSLGSSPIPMPLSESADDDIYINNFSQRVHPSCDIEEMHPVFVTGEEFLAETQYTVYLIEPTQWPDASAIPHGNVVTMTDVTTDTDGKIPQTLIWEAYRPNGHPDLGYQVVVDYDGDGLFYSPRDRITIDVLEGLPTLCGDCNCDGLFNGGDIDPFFQALGDPAAWQAAHPGCDLLCAADINRDGAVNGGDIDPFFEALATGKCPP